METGEIELEDILDRAIRDREAFPWMINHPKVKPILDRVSASAAWEFNQDKDDVRAELVCKLFQNLEKIRNPRCLDFWCRPVARNYCRDQRKHTVGDLSYSDEISLGGCEGKRRGGRPLVQTGLAVTAEERFLLNDALYGAIGAFPQPLVKAWASGKTLKEISLELHMPLATVHRKLTKIQKAIIEALKELGYVPDQNEEGFKRVLELVKEHCVESLAYN